MRRVVQIIRAIPLTFNTLILRAPGGFARIFTICCDCSPKSVTCSKKECSCKFYLRGEKDCSWMCERAEPTGDVFNRERFEARLIDYKDENFILGREDAGDGGGEEEDDGSSSANTVTDADLDDDKDSDDEGLEEGNDWEEPDKDEGELGSAVYLFGLKLGELDDIFMEQEPLSFLKSSERSFVVDEDSSDGNEKDESDEEKEEDE